MQTINSKHSKQQDVTALITSGFKSKNTGGQTCRRDHQVGVGDSESTPVETALPVDSHVEPAKCVVKTGSLGA